MNFSQWGKEPEQTGYETNTLKEMVKATVDIPEGFNVHSRLRRMYIEDRLKSINNDKVDWASAEAMALGSLAFEGYNTRLVGEDSERGTFSQRHMVFHDQDNGNECRPFRDSQFMKQAKGRMQVYNTNLCELGSMAYEYGYSLENPKNLCIWEAQFGDFYNPAQLVVD